MSISIQGAVPSGTILTDDPVLMAGADAGAVVRTVHTDASGSVVVVGATPVGSVATGNPVRIGVVDNTGLVQNWAQTITTTAQFAGSVGIGAVVALLNDNSAGFRNQVGFFSDAQDSRNVAYAGRGSLNGATTDRDRNNVDATLLASAIRTASVTGADITTYNLGGIVVVLDVTSGSGTLNIVINGKDPASGKYYPLLTGTGVTSTSTNIYRVWPSATPSAGLVANDRLPRTINIVVNAANANLVQYSVGYTLLVT